MNPVRILVVEDDPDFCLLITETFRDLADFMIAGICMNGGEAADLAASVDADIVLMDLNLSGKPGTNLEGVEASRQIRLKTRAKVILLSAYEDPEIVIRASRQAFASGYVMKSQFRMLVPTVQQTAQGVTPQSHMILSSIMNELSAAERSVLLQMIGRGNTVLRSSKKTIANQQTSVLRKLGLTGRKELVHVFEAYY